MSHHGTNWAINQRGLKPTTKLVLWHLADRHNPDNGCFPSQQRLAEDCEISRSVLNVHLAKLEESGLIIRVRRIDPKTKKQTSTRYFLSFEEGFADKSKEANQAAGRAATKPCPETGHGAVSGNEAEPCPENSVSRVRNQDTNLVREPLRKPCVHTNAKDAVPVWLDKFVKAHPRPRDQGKCLELISAAIADGVSIDWIIQSAERYQAENKGNKPMYVAYADNWLDQKRWQDYPTPTGKETAGAGANDLVAFWADKIRNRRYVPRSAVSAALARDMMGQQLVTPEELRAAGIYP